MEVLSANDRAGQVTRKITDYLTSGVALVWLIDPEDRSVTIYRRNWGPVPVAGEAEWTGVEVLPGLHCRVDLFLVPGELP